MKTESDILLEILGDKLVSLNATFLGQTAADPYINISAFPLVYEAMRLYSDQQSKVTGETSDGYHTFNELYEHRHVLFLALLKTRTDAWKSWKHEDGSAFEGWFIAGIGDKITYHIPARLWDAFAVPELPKAPKWDGHTSNDVIERLKLLDADQQNKELRGAVDRREHIINIKDADIQRLTKEVGLFKNDLLDALDLKNGNGPTALTMLSNELTRLRELLGRTMPHVQTCEGSESNLLTEIDNAIRQ